LRYLALGDSYTIGTGATSHAHAWPSIVASRLDVELTYPAVNGYTTEDLIRDELPLYERLQPELVTVLIGANDLVQGRTPDIYGRWLARIYDAVSAARVVAVSIPNWYYVPAAAQFGGAARIERLTATRSAPARTATANSTSSSRT
jgi:acyl-CoA thioesterase-1